MSQQPAQASSAGLFTLLGLVFITLKLLDKLDWPWIWVLAPFWVPTAVILVITLIVLAVAMWKTR